MGDILVLAGERYNVLQTGTVTVSTEDPLYPGSRLYDGRPIQPFKTTGTTDETIDVDGNRVVNGNFDSWSAGAPTGWTVGGTVTEETVAVRSGSAVRINGGGASYVLQRVTCRSGEQINIDGWRRILAAGQGQFKAYLLNRATNHYWDGATWATPFAPFVSDSTNTSYTQHSSTVTVEGYSTVLADTCPIDLILLNDDPTATDYVYVDDWFIWPSIDFCAVFGHNLGSGTGIELLRGSSSPASTSETLLTVKPTSFYVKLGTTRTTRYYRLRFVNPSNVEAFVLGEVVLGKVATLTRRMTDEGYTIQDEFDTIAAVSETGDHMAVSRSNGPRKNLSMEFRFTGTSADTDLDQQREELFERSQGDARSVVIVPDSARPDVVMGKIDRSFGVRRFLSDYYTGRTLVVNGLPFPLLTS